MPRKRCTISTSTTLAWASDIHLDHADPDAIMMFIDRVRTSGAAALLLGGDISTAAVLEEHLVQIEEMTGLPVHFVLGNHDFYGGSIASVLKKIGSLSRPNLHWLEKAGLCEIAPGVTLIGIGGWGDARLGDFPGSDVVLTDYLAIAELRRVFDNKLFTGTFGPGSALEAELRRLGQQAAKSFAPQLSTAARTSGHVVVLTHVPPFREACWHEGAISADPWLPGFTCGAMGKILSETAAAHPKCAFTVLCGHTHGGGFARISPNLVVHTQAAEYGRPDFLVLEVSPDGVQIHD